MMWDAESRFYYDLDENENIIKNPHIGGFYTMLAEIPNDEYASFLIEELKDDELFGTDNPFPTVPKSSKYFDAKGNGYRCGVVPFCTYMVIRGLMNYNSFIFARECAIRHMYYILDTLHPDQEVMGETYEIYRPTGEGAAASSIENRVRYLPMLGLVTITLIIENIVGLDISLPRKTVYWTMQALEEMGIEKLSLKKNKQN